VCIFQWNGEGIGGVKRISILNLERDRKNERDSVKKTPSTVFQKEGRGSKHKECNRGDERL
jgi:hypothetical protein